MNKVQINNSIKAEGLFCIHRENLELVFALGFEWIDLNPY